MFSSYTSVPGAELGNPGHHVAQARARSQRTRAAAALLTTALAATALVAWLQHNDNDRSSSLRSQVHSLIERNEENCGVGEDDIDLSTKKALFEMQHIVSATDCNAKCERESNCGAWTWGKSRHKPGLSDVCFLKKLMDDEKPKKHHQEGVVSGIPCKDRPASTTKAEAEAPNEPSTKAVSTTTTKWRPPTRTTTVTTRAQVHPNANPGTLFCWALMMPFGWEPVLLASQYKAGTSLFGCDEFQVYSNTSLTVTPGLTTNVVDISLTCDYGGEFKTALNNDIFMAVWSKVVADGFSELHDWTVKVDPDCVFFPNRLIAMLYNHSEGERGTYINNCFRGMHGPIEVFSRIAIRVWAWGKDQCVRHFWRLCSGDCKWGEDMFIDQCMMKVLNVRRDNDWNLLLEEHCDPPEGWQGCTDPNVVAFHPFKSVDGYNECLTNAMAASSQFPELTAPASPAQVLASQQEPAAPAADQQALNLATASPVDYETAAQPAAAPPAAAVDYEMAAQQPAAAPPAAAVGYYETSEMATQRAAAQAQPQQVAQQFVAQRTQVSQVDQTQATMQ